jgi:hypothetical protein
MPAPVNEDAAGTSASTSGGRQHHPTTTDVESRMHAVAAWLSNKAKEEPGYTAFKAGQHHVQPNASVVASWQFAVRFCEKYSQRHCSAGVSVCSGLSAFSADGFLLIGSKQPAPEPYERYAHQEKRRPGFPWCRLHMDGRGTAGSADLADLW